jgi:hypothetical protein
MTRLEPKSSVKKITALSAVEAYEMHQVFLKYYNNADLETFLKDISKKQYVLLIKDRQSNTIVGFSTIALMNLTYKGKKVLGLFSGDTILEKEYWGSRRWQLTWGLFCLKLKLQNFRTPFFWLLISKGYKTYMLMANNFINYYPRIDKEDEALARVVDSYCDQLYPDFYVQCQRVLDFGEQYQNLQSHVAEICDDLRESQPKIRFFEERNPDWRRGTELPCVGIMEIPVLVKFVKKIVREKFAKNKKIRTSENLQTQ